MQPGEAPAQAIICVSPDKPGQAIIPLLTKSYYNEKDLFCI